MYFLGMCLQVLGILTGFILTGPTQSASTSGHYSTKVCLANYSLNSSHCPSYRYSAARVPVVLAVFFCDPMYLLRVTIRTNSLLFNLLIIIISLLSLPSTHHYLTVRCLEIQGSSYFCLLPLLWFFLMQL